MLKRLNKGVKFVGLRAITLLIIILVRLALTFFSHRLILKVTPSQFRGVAPDAMAWRVASAVSSMARMVPGASCLTQALAMYAILAFRGYASEIRIGVKRGGGSIAAHAWLLSGGKLVLGGSPQEIAEYVPLTILGLPHT